MRKKILVGLVLLVSVFGLMACKVEEEQPTQYIVLPDLIGLTEEDVVSVLEDLGVSYTIEYHEEQSRTYDNQFIMYLNHNIGDIVAATETIELLLYPVYVSDTIITLPDFDGIREDDMISQLQAALITYYVEYVVTDNEALHGFFVQYIGDNEAGDEFDNISAIGIEVYQYRPPVTDEYFTVQDMDYLGPYLDQLTIGAEYMNPRGGSFEVTLLSCTDGDTSRFIYPNDIYNAINSTAKSVRFLNMDTEETYPGGEEEWGKPASVYTCSLLEEATSIVLQTDPGDGLLDTHGRLLAWVWIQLPGETEYQLLNYMVVRQGLAQVKYEFGAGEDLSYGDYTYNEWMHIAEDLAIDEDLGQWGYLLDYYWDYEADEPDFDRWYE